jgi:hypothetical protein
MRRASSWRAERSVERPGRCRGEVMTMNSQGKDPPGHVAASWCGLKLRRDGRSRRARSGLAISGRQCLGQALPMWSYDRTRPSATSPASGAGLEPVAEGPGALEFAAVGAWVAPRRTWHVAGVLKTASRRPLAGLSEARSVSGLSRTARVARRWRPPPTSAHPPAGVPSATTDSVSSPEAPDDEWTDVVVIFLGIEVVRVCRQRRERDPSTCDHERMLASESRRRRPANCRGATSQRRCFGTDVPLVKAGFWPVDVGFQVDDVGAR